MREEIDALQVLRYSMFEGAAAASSKESRAAERTWKLPLLERLAQRIVDGERNGLDVDLDEIGQVPPCCSEVLR